MSAALIAVDCGLEVTDTTRGRLFLKEADVRLIIDDKDIL